MKQKLSYYLQSVFTLIITEVSLLYNDTGNLRLLFPSPDKVKCQGHRIHLVKNSIGPLDLNTYIYFFVKHRISMPLKNARTIFFSQIDSTSRKRDRENMRGGGGGGIGFYPLLSPNYLINTGTSYCNMPQHKHPYICNNTYILHTDISL